MGPASLRALAVALLIGFITVAGCGGRSPSERSIPVKLLDDNALPRDKVKDGGTLRLPIGQFSSQWNYNQLDGPDASTYAVMSALMPVPFVADEHGVVEPNRNYIISARVTATKPDQTVTISLNHKARWSDGRPITERDYEAEWRALRGTDDRFEIASSTGYERVAKVTEGADPYQVVVTFNRPFAEWMSLFTPLYPASTNSTPREFNTAYHRRIPITAGSFKLGRIDETAQTVTIVRDPLWWGARAKLDSIVFRTLETDAQVNAFANGELDVVDIGASPSAYRRAADTPGTRIYTAAAPDFRHFTINGTSPMLSNSNVRRAIAMAINRNAIAKSDLTGLPWPARTMDNHFFVTTQTGYKNNADDVGTYNPGKARELLEQAGWKRSGSFRTKHGRILELRFVIPTGVQVSRQEGELIQAMLKDVGVKVDVTAVPSNDFFDKYVIPGAYDITAFSWLGSPFPISASKSIYARPSRDAHGALRIQQNFARVGSREIDRLMDKAEGQIDQSDAYDILNRADTLIWKEVHSLPLYQRPEITATKTNVANYGSFGFKTPVYEDIGFAK